MWWIIGLIVLVLVIKALTPITPEAVLIDQNEEEKNRNSLINLYGKLSKEIKWGYFNLGESYLKANHDKTGIIYCFEDSNTIVINGRVFPFKLIVGCDLAINGNVAFSASTKTSTGSLLGRAVVGGIIGGGVGAIVGGASAKKETITTQETKICEVYVNLNEISNPQIVVEFLDDEKAAREFASLLSLIIDRNKAQS